MKKVLSLILIFTFLLTFSGCENNTELSSGIPSSHNSSSDNNNSSKDENEKENSSGEETESKEDEKEDNTENTTPSKPQNSSVPTSGKPVNGGTLPDNNSSNQNTVSKPENQDTSPKEPDNSGDKTVNDSTQKPDGSTGEPNEENKQPEKVCEHKNESSKYVAPTCTVDGYYEYICDDCGNIRLENLPAKHIFMEYICTECGIADKDNAVLALNYWVEKNGKRKDDSPDKPYEYFFEDKEIKYIISSFKGELTISFLNSALSEKIDIIIYDSEECNISYISYGVWGSSKLKKEDIFMDNTSLWNDFPLGSGNKKEIEECRKTLKNAVYNIFNFFNDNLFENKLKITFSDIGFTNLKINPTDLTAQ